MRLRIKVPTKILRHTQQIIGESFGFKLGLDQSQTTESEHSKATGSLTGEKKRARTDPARWLDGTGDGSGRLRGRRGEKRQPRSRGRAAASIKP
jgi:hypothetical protein